MPNITSSLLEDFLAEVREFTGGKLANVELEMPFGSPQKTGRLDALARLKLPDGSHVTLAIEILGRAYPRDIMQVLHHLAKYKSIVGHDDPTVALAVVAESISPGARQELREAGVNYYDATTSMYFHHGTYKMAREIQNVERKPRRPVRLFTGAREKLVHALLEHWRKTGGDYVPGGQLAYESQTSTYTVSSTMQELERETWVESVGSGPTLRRRLDNPAALLDAWADDWVTRKEEHLRLYLYAPDNLIDTVLAGLHGLQGWALTGAAAANTVVPYLTSVDRVQVIVPPGKAQAWAAQLGYKRAEKGSNLHFIEREGASLMFQDTHPERPGSRFASRFIQYLDLLDGYGRNGELAAEYRRKALQIEPRA